MQHKYLNDWFIGELSLVEKNALHKMYIAIHETRTFRETGTNKSIRKSDKSI